jgi:hypothetical protein
MDSTICVAAVRGKGRDRTCFLGFIRILAIARGRSGIMGFTHNMAAGSGKGRDRSYVLGFTEEVAIARGRNTDLGFISLMAAVNFFCYHNGNAASNGVFMLADLERRSPGLFWTFIWIFAIACLLLSTFDVYADKPEGAPESTPAEHNFFVGATDHNGLSCCSEADGYREGISYIEKLNAAYPHPGGIILREWTASKDVPGGYRVNIAGIWKDVPPDHVVKSPPNPPNVTGAAVVWVTFTFHNITINDGGGGTTYKMTDNIANMDVRCFSPGNQF